MNIKELIAQRKELTSGMTKLVSEQRSGEEMDKKNIQLLVIIPQAYLLFFI